MPRILAEVAVGVNPIGMQLSLVINEMALLAPSPPVVGGDGWLPIESAPKDESVLLFSPGKNISDDPAEPYDIRVSTTRNWCWATHWRPLPSPPPQGVE